MNIVLSGPFGMGSLSDELALAGVLKPLRAAKHVVTVLSADKTATEKTHGVTAVHVASAASLLSTPAAWKALEQAHLFVLCGGGTISETGKPPARTWLAQLEHVRQLKLPTAVVGVGARVIEDMREQVRVQRLLHHFADGISVRDEESKLALIEMALNANRVSITGDPTLALFDAQASKPNAKKRIAFFFADGVPMRKSFSPEPTSAPAALGSGLNALLKTQLEGGCDAAIFHDNSQQNERLARAIASGADAARVKLFGARAVFAEVRSGMTECAAAITDTLHGMCFAAACGVPAIYLNEAPGDTGLAERLGLGAFVLKSEGGVFDGARAMQLFDSLRALPETKRQEWLKIVANLERKEAANARMMEKLVPKRLRYPKREHAEHSDEKRKENRKDEGRARKSPAWNRY